MKRMMQKSGYVELTIWNSYCDCLDFRYVLYIAFEMPFVSIWNQ
jgi:hypothetical protein